MKALIPWLILAAAIVQFVRVALPPGNADLISIETLAYDFAHNEDRFLYPGAGFSHNDEWTAHHEHNIAQFGLEHTVPNWCFYPPLVPYMFSPFATVDAQTWRIVWGIVQIALMPLFAEVIVSLLRKGVPGANVSRVWVYALVFGSYPVARVLQVGQTSLLIAALFWIGVLARMNGRRWLGALSAGAALFVKPFIALAEVMPAIRRMTFAAWSAVAVSAALLLISLVFIGVRAHAEYLSFLATLSSSQTAFWGNQSLFGGLMRLFTNLPATDYGFQYDPNVAEIGRFIAVVVLAAAAVAQWRSFRVDSFASIGLWISAALLALPISWEHHLILMLPVIAYLWTRRGGAKATAALAAATVLISVYWVPFYSEELPGRMIECFPLIGNLILFSLLIVLHVRSRAVEAAAVTA